MGHEEVGARLFHEWKFPEDLVAPVRFHHDPENAPEPYRQHARIVFCAEYLADLLWIENIQPSLDRASDYLQEKLDLPAKALHEILNEVSEAVTQAASMLEIKVGHQPNYQEIAEAASRGLLALNMSYQALADELQRSLDLQQELSAELQRQNQELEHLARTDKLTGLPNRRAFDESLDRELARSVRVGSPVSLILIDVDRFKNCNDIYGHSAGDCVLQKVGQIIRETIRTVDIPARYGGEEFAVIMPHTDGPGALTVAERIRRAIAATPVDFEGQTLQVTVSIGITTIQDASSPRAFVMAMRSADDALYEAKVGGRNKSSLKQQS
jgi:diguanylate cyclase (GGDEF)-like protein